MSTSQESSRATRTPPDDISRAQDSFASGQPFPQLPHLVVPCGERRLTSTALLKYQRSYHLRLFWDVCHPLLQIMSETEFAELDALPPAGYVW